MVGELLGAPLPSAGGPAACPRLPLELGVPPQPPGTRSSLRSPSADRTVGPPGDPLCVSPPPAFFILSKLHPRAFLSAGRSMDCFWLPSLPLWCLGAPSIPLEPTCTYPPSLTSSVISRCPPVPPSADRPADTIISRCTGVPSEFLCLPWYSPLRFLSLSPPLHSVILCYLPTFPRHVCTSQLTPLHPECYGAFPHPIPASRSLSILDSPLVSVWSHGMYVLPLRQGEDEVEL